MKMSCVQRCKTKFNHDKRTKKKQQPCTQPNNSLAKQFNTYQACTGMHLHAPGHQGTGRKVPALTNRHMHERCA